MLGRLKNAFSALRAKGASGDFDRIYDLDPTEGSKLREAYRESVWVMRAIKTVATPIASVPLNFSEGETMVEDGRLSAFWHRPFVGMSYFDGIEATVGWLKLEGEAFWLADDSWMVPFASTGRRAQLMIARPDRMRAIVRDDEIVAWEYRSPKGKPSMFLPEQVWHHKFWNPYDSIRGLAEMKAVENAAESDYLAGLFKRNLMRSNGDRGVYVIAKHGIPDDAQRKQIVEQIRAKQRANQRGEARITFLHGGEFEIEDPKIQVPDAAFHAGRIQDRHEIFIGFGIPASMADVQASYSIGSASDRFRLIEDTCMPLGAKIAEGIEYFAARQSGRPALQASPDWDEHSVMQAVRAERIESADKLATRGMPMREISDYLRLGLPRFAGDDVGYLPINVVPVGESLDPAGDPSLEERSSKDEGRRTKQSAAYDAMIEALKSTPDPEPVIREDGDGQDESEKFQESRPARERKLWQMHMSARNASVKRYERAFRRVLFEARKETLRKIDEKGGALKTAMKAAAADFVFDLEIFRAAFFGAMRKAAQQAFRSGGSQVLEEIEIDDPFEAAPEEVLLFLRQRENLLRNIPDAIHGEIMDTLREGIEGGEAMDKLAARVRDRFNAIDAARARTIAQTETAASYGSGRHAAMKQSGVRHKRWLTSGNANVRPSHRRANGQTVKVDEDFEVGDAFLAHPADHSGPPEETINCHCVSIAVRVDEDE